MSLFSRDQANLYTNDFFDLLTGVGSRISHRVFSFWKREYCTIIHTIRDKFPNNFPIISKKWCRVFEKLSLTRSFFSVLGRHCTAF